MEKLGKGAPRLSVGRLLSFTFPSLPLAALGLPFVVQLPPHYAGHVGIDLATVGLIFMAARLADIGIDLGLGLLMDKTRWKHGRFTLWLLLSAPLLAITTYFLFMAPAGSGPLRLLLVLFLTYCAFSMGTLSQTALGATLSSDYNERSRVFAWWQSGNIIGMLLVLVLPAIVSARGGTPEQGVFAMGWFIIILSPISALVAARFAKEEPPKAAAAKVGMADVISLAHVKGFWPLIGADLTFSFASGAAGGMFLYMFHAALDLGNQANLLMLLYFVSGLIGAGLWAFLAKKLGKHRALMVSVIWFAFGLAALVWVPKGHLIEAAITMVFAGLAYAGPLYLMRAMMADVGDGDLLATGKDRTGLLYSCLNLTSKGGYALAVGVGYIALDKSGFVPALAAQNGASAIAGLKMTFLAQPALACLLAALGLLFYRLGPKEVADIQTKLEARNIHERGTKKTAEQDF